MGNSTSTAVSQRLDHASKTGGLSLSELKLEEIPVEVVRLESSLRTLDVSFNRLSFLPGSLGRFSALRTLSANNNKLAQIPSSLGNLKKLETLYIHFNVLSSLPDTLSSLNSLKKLDISHNLLTTFPGFLYSLPHLNYLNISSNKLTALPEEGIEQLSALELNLSSNSIQSLPVGLSKCQRLKVLRVEENSLELCGLPQELFEKSNVSLLCLDGNLFRQKELQELPGYSKYMERFTATRRKVD